MIYSEDINRVCGLCVSAAKTESGEEMYCSLKKKNVPVSQGDCGKFKYDIFKKQVRRKKRLKTDFSAADFSLDD